MMEWIKTTNGELAVENSFIVGYIAVTDNYGNPTQDVKARILQVPVDFDENVDVSSPPWKRNVVLDPLKDIPRPQFPSVELAKKAIEYNLSRTVLQLLFVNMRLMERYNNKGGDIG